jgi:hypothetical protein
VFGITQNIELGNSSVLSFRFLELVLKIVTKLTLSNILGTRYFEFGFTHITQKTHMDGGANKQRWRYWRLLTRLTVGEDRVPFQSKLSEGQRLDPPRVC